MPGLKKRLLPAPGIKFNFALHNLTRKKKFVEKLSESEKNTLEHGHRYGKSADFRQRCQILLISNRRYDVKQIAEMLEVNPKTVYSTLRNWREDGLAGLMRKKGQGRKAILEPNNPTHVNAVKKAIEKHAQNKPLILKELYRELGIEQMSIKSLSRFLRKIDDTASNYDKKNKRK